MNGQHWRIIWWLIWSNLITLLATAQGVIAALMLQSDIFSHSTFRILVISNAVLTAVVAQIKRNTPPGPRPEREPEHGTQSDPPRDLS